MRLPLCFVWLWSVVVWSSREGLGREAEATSAQVTVKAGLTCFTRKNILPSLACTGRHSGSRHRSRPRECSAEVGELSLSSRFGLVHLPEAVFLVD